MESKEELLQKLNNLPEKEKKKIENMKNLEGKELEEAIGGLHTATKILLGSLGVMAVCTAAFSGSETDGYDSENMEYKFSKPFDSNLTLTSTKSPYNTNIDNMEILIMGLRGCRKTIDTMNGFLNNRIQKSKKNTNNKKHPTK